MRNAFPCDQRPGRHQRHHRREGFCCPTLPG